MKEDSSKTRNFSDSRMQAEELNWELAVNKAIAKLSDALINPSSSIEEIADIVLDHAKVLTQSEHGYVSSIDPETGDNVGHTLTKMMGEQCLVSDVEKRIVFSKGADGQYPGLWGYSLNTHKPLYTNRPEQHKASRGIPKGHIPLNNFLSVPAMIGDKVVGQIALANSRSGYTRQHLDAIIHIAKLYAVAIQRKQTEKTLRESEQKFRSLVEASSDWIWEVDRNGIYTYASPKVKDLLGYEPEEIIGKTPFDLMSPAEAERVNRLFKDIVKSSKAFAGLLNTNLHKDGRRVVLETSGVPIFDLGGNLLGYRGIDRDVTEREEAEEQIESLAKFPSENPSPVLRIAKDGTVLYVNFAGSELLEVWNCKAGAHAPEHWYRCILRVLKSGLNEDCEVVCKDRIFSMRMTPIVDCGYVNVYGIDITERKQAEENLRKHQQHLEELVQIRTGELTEANKKLLQEIEQRKRLEKEILDISERERRWLGQELHDSLGQQLTGISFMTKALEQKLTTKSLSEADDIAEVAKLVNQATDQARGLAKGLHPVDLDTGSLMMSLQELAASTEQLFGIRCTFKCDKPVPIDDAAVAIHLYRITQETITNAIRHGRAKNIQIGLAYGRNKSVLTIKSDGLDFPDKTQAMSTGMGLQIMGHRADIIGGSLDVHKGPEGGTVVTCVFPNKKRQQ